MVDLIECFVVLDAIEGAFDTTEARGMLGGCGDGAFDAQWSDSESLRGVEEVNALVAKAEKLMSEFRERDLGEGPVGDGVVHACYQSEGRSKREWPFFRGAAESSLGKSFRVLGRILRMVA